MTISVKSAKAKGRRLQNWMAEQISKMLGIPCGKDKEIQGREMGQSGTDVKLYGKALKLFPFSIECKAQETWSLPAWIKQAKSNIIEGTDWLLVCKKSRQDRVIVIDAKVFFKIYNELLKLKYINKEG